MNELIFKSEYSNSWALIIGINNYVNGALNFATNDAESIAEILKERFNFPKKNITILLDKEATRAKIMSSFLKFSKKILILMIDYYFFLQGMDILFQVQKVKWDI